MRRLLITATIVSLFLPFADAGNVKAGDVIDILKAKDFWDKEGKMEEREWTNTQRNQLADLKSSSADNIIRLRASRVLVELAGKASYNVGKGDKAIAVAGFQYLEANIKNQNVKRMLDVGITHFHVSTNTTQGGTWLLVENVGNKQGGGLNLRWDAEKKSILEMVAWGFVKGE